MSKWELINPETGEHVLYDEETGAPVYFDSSEAAQDVIDDSAGDGLKLVMVEIK